MGIDTEKYIRKPLYVDAVRVNAQNFDEIVAWCQGEVLQDEVPGSGTTKKYIKVRVHNPKNPRQTKAFIGDWILYTERGYKVYTNKAFRAAFDLVGEGGTAVETPAAPQEERIETNLVPKFYLDPESGMITETMPDVDARPLGFGELMNIIRTELIGEELEDPIEQAQPAEPGLQQATLESGHPIDPEEPVATATVTPIDHVEVHSVGPVAEDPDPTGTGVQPIQEVIDGPQLTADTAHGADVVVDTPIAPPPTPAIVPPEPEESRLQTETGSDQKIKHEPQSPFSQDGGGPVDLADDVAQEKARPVTEQSPNVAASGKRVLSEEEQRRMTPAEVRGLVQTGEVVLAQDLAETA